MPTELPDSQKSTEDPRPGLMEDIRIAGALMADCGTLIDDIRALVSHVREMRRYKRCKARAAGEGIPFLELH